MEIAGFIIRWTVILLWRFFTGAHMNGKTYNDATWWQDASVHYRRKRSAYTWWRRKSRMNRSRWRNAILWPVVLIIAGFMWSTSSMIVILGMLAPGIFVIARKRLRPKFYNPVVARGSNGEVTQTWILKPKWSRVVKKIRPPKGERRRPGLAMDSEITPGTRLVDISDEDRHVIAGELAEDLGGEPPLEMKLLMQPENT